MEEVFEETFLKVVKVNHLNANGAKTRTLGLVRNHDPIVHGPEFGGHSLNLATNLFEFV